MAKMPQVSLLAIYQGRSYTLIVSCSLCSYKRNRSIAASDTSTTFPAGSVLESLKYYCGTESEATIDDVNNFTQLKDRYGNIMLPINL